MNKKYGFLKRTLVSKLEIMEGHAESILKHVVTISGKKYWLDGTDGTITRLNTVKESGELLKLLLEEQAFIELGNSSIEFILNTITPLNSFNMLKYDRDILADEIKIIQDREELTVTIVFAGLLSPRVNEAFTQTEANWFIDEYKQHFKELDEVTKFIVYSRVYPHKRSFLSYTAQSDFGKSFYIASLEDSRLGVEIHDIENLMSGSSSTPAMGIVNTCCLLFDEFEYFKKELKHITFQVKVAEKYQMSTPISIGLKIAFMANVSASLIGAVDDQIQNRFNSIMVKNKTKLGDLESVQSLGTYVCRAILAEYMAVLARETIEELKLTGNAKFEAKMKVEEFGERYNLNESDETISLMDGLHREIVEAIEGKQLHDKNIIQVEDGYLLTATRKTIKALLEVNLDEKEVKYYMSVLRDYFVSEKHVINFMNSPRRVKELNNKSKRGIIVKWLEN